MKSIYLSVSFTLLGSLISPSLLRAGELSIPQYPLQSTGFVEPNVMLLIDNSGSMRNYVGSQKRLDIAKDVATKIVNNTDDVRFCLSTFNFQHGGRVLQACGESKSNITNDIARLHHENWTPLAEAYYEVVGYFRGGSSLYNSGSYNSPIQYRCQKNFAIVLTDGLPTYDMTFPNITANYDGINTQPGDPGYPQFSDGTGGSEGREGSSLYLDDIAKYAWDTDLRQSGNDTAGKSFNDSLFQKQNLHTYTVGFTVSNQMLRDAAESYGNGKYYEANNASELEDSFGKALTQITSDSQSVAAASANSGEIAVGTRIYQSRYTASQWKGDLLAFSIDPTTLLVSASPVWSAPVETTSNKWVDRAVFMGLNNGQRFKWNKFTGAQKSAWFNSDRDILDYIKGTSYSKFRERTSPLGDIVSSAPVYDAAAKSGLYNDSDFGAAYSTYYNDNKNRDEVIYVGSNDGMLHVFNAADGTAKFSYIPTTVLPNLKALSEKNYTHQFYVDSTPTVAPVYSSTDGWFSLLVGGLARGGQGIYALDVTEVNPSYNNNAATKLAAWEFSDANDADLGFTYSKPQILRMEDGNFYVVLGNGYNSNSTVTNAGGVDSNVSATGDGVLYLLNVSTGAVVKKISTQVGMDEDPSGQRRANGLTTVSGFDADGNGKIDRIYAGDLFGNVWRFNFSSADPQSWGGVSDTLKLFTACASNTCTTGVNTNHQPITSKITVQKFISGDIMLFFGTGKLLEVVDTVKANIPIQTVYGIKDLVANIPSRSSLLQQDITLQKTVEFSQTDGGTAASREIRLTSNNAISSESGWFLDLQKPTVNLDGSISYSLEGEQVVVPMIYRDDKVFVVTNAPNTTDPCLPSSQNFFMELTAVSGARLDYVAADLSGDGKIDDNDGYDTGTVDTFGKKIVVAVSAFAISSNQTPTVVNILDENGNETNEELMVFTTNTGGFTNTVKGLKRKGVIAGSRKSWREIRN